jgi:hypothetical protein
MTVTAAAPLRPKTVSRADFDAAYEALILDRTFVEDVNYYYASRQRFWLALCHIADIGLPPGARAVDIGGGIMGVLMARLLGFDVVVADVTERARDRPKSSLTGGAGPIGTLKPVPP